MDDFEERFWGDCCRSFGEEEKQRIYMRFMGIPEVVTWRSPLNYDFGGRSVIDIGGGPCSVLLKGENLKNGLVVDPTKYPSWVAERYIAANIRYLQISGEQIQWQAQYDLALVYNCLQHCTDPEKIISNARAVAKDLKMFEWIDLPAHEGHPWELKAADLEKWTGREGKVVELTGENGCYGRAWVLA